MWTIKFIPVTSIGFLLVLLATCGLGKLLDYVFTPRELYILDDLLPGQQNDTFEVGENENGKVIRKGVAYDSECFQMEEIEECKVFIYTFL